MLHIIFSMALVLWTGACNNQPGTINQLSNTAFYFVPASSTRAALEQVVPNNSYFAQWGGPHITVGGFVNANASQIQQIAADLKQLGTGWQITQFSQINIINSSGLMLAYFSSPFLDQAAQVLKSNNWTNVKSSWHLTLGNTAEVNGFEQQMAELLVNSNWEWIVVTRDQQNNITWKKI